MPPAPSTPARRLRQAVLALVGIALFLGFVALGTWQVERRAWKLTLMARVAQRVHAPPVPAPLASDWPAVNASDHEYLPVTLHGHWLGGKTVLTQAVTELGAGFWVMTALQQADGSQVLVNRGFVPQDQRAQWLAAAPAPSEPASVAVQGLLRMSEPGGGFLRTNEPAQQRWYSRDVAAISQTLGLPRAAPFFVDAGLPGRPGNPDAPPVTTGGDTWPRPGMTVVRFHNSHLVYALTWYGLALMVAGAGWYVARYERRRSGMSSPLATNSPDVLPPT
jgi:surfeit locus 1 family protein